MSIEVNQLTKIYGEQKAVNDISFNINSGEIVGFLGPNGAGKSTTMKMLTTYIEPTSGTAEVAGFDILQHPLSVKKSVGYLPENNPLYYEMFVREYLQFAAKIHQLKNVKERVEEVIALTGLTKEVKKKIGTLSKGYKQRVGIAQAIIHNPSVLILDEPTSGLDPNQIEDIRQLIINIGKDKSVMLSTHIMQEVEAMCSRVIIINNGKIVKDNSLAEAQSKRHATVEVIFETTVNTIDLEQILLANNELQLLNESHFLIATQDATATKKRIMQKALEKEWNIVSINDYNERLEDVFKKATKQ